MSGKKATPRRQPGARQNETAIDCNRLIGDIVPRRDLMPDYVVLALLLHHPDLAAPHVSCLHPGAWAFELHRIVARIALSHLRTIGRVDLRQLAAVLHDADVIRPATLRLELETLARVADLLRADDIVADAVATLTAYRQGVAA